MAIRVDKKERVSVYYIGRKGGLTDVRISLYEPNGDAYVSSGVMTELSTVSGIYVYTFLPPPYDKTYFAVMDSSSYPKKTTEHIVVSPTRKSGGMFMKKGEIWTATEKKKLLDAVNELTEKLGRLGEGMAVITKKQEETILMSKSGVDSLRERIYTLSGDFNKLVSLWDSYIAQNTTTAEKHDMRLNKIEVSLSNIKKTDTDSAKKLHEITSSVEVKLSSLIEETSKQIDVLMDRVDSYAADIRNRGRLDDERLPRMLAELEDIRLGLEDFKQAFVKSLPLERIELMEMRLRNGNKDNA